MSKACEESMKIQDMIEEMPPNIVESFKEFHDLAIRALDCQLERVSTLELNDSNYYDIIANNANLLKAARENADNLNKNIQTLQARIAKISLENDEMALKLGEIRKKPINIRFLKQFNSHILEIEDLSSKIMTYTELCKEKEQKIAEFKQSIDDFHRNKSDSKMELLNRIKKNNKKIAELEARVKKSMVLSTSQKKECFSEVIPTQSPSTIIHRTVDSSQDQIRVLKSAMEESIKRNTSLKVQLKGLDQDIAAMKEENTALKEIMRTIQSK